MAKTLSITNLKKTYYYLKRNGIMQTMGAALERIQSPYHADYCYVCPSHQELQKQRRERWNHPVVFSVVVPAYETRKEFLDVLINSIQEQTYPYWELVIADASTSNIVKSQCEQYGDERIKYFSLSQNAGISENTNQGLEQAKGDYIGLLDHDDYLTPDALYEMAKAIQQGREKNLEYGFLYSDEDKCDELGENFYDPHFKTDFNLDLFLTNNYVCHFCVMERTLIQKLKFRKEYDGAQDYDLCLRAVRELWKENQKVEQLIYHIPKVLYHWRCHNDSTAANPQSKRYAYEAGKKALQDFVKMQGWKAEVEEMSHVGFYRLLYENGIFAQREDVLAVGRKEIRHGRICSNAFDKEGKMLYKDIPFCYTGYIHRAVLTQNVEELDIDKWEINPRYKNKVEDFLKEENAGLAQDKNNKQKSVCHYFKEQGYRLYWDPSIKN